MDGWAHVGRPLGHASRGDLPPRADRAGAVSLHVVRNRSRRPPGEHVEDVPVLRSRTRIVVLLLLIEAFDLEPVEQRMSALSRERGDLVVRRPGVPLAQYLAAETAAGAYRVAHLSPDLRPTPAGAEEEAEPRPDQVGLGELDLLHTRHRRPQPPRELGRDPRSKAADALGLGIGGEHPPASLEHREGVDAGAAPEVHGIVRTRPEPG